MFLKGKTILIAAGFIFGSSVAFAQGGGGAEKSCNAPPSPSCSSSQGDGRGPSEH
jgi:hypothetical protein